MREIESSSGSSIHCKRPFLSILAAEKFNVKPAGAAEAIVEFLTFLRLAVNLHFHIAGNLHQTVEGSQDFLLMDFHTFDSFFET